MTPLSPTTRFLGAPRVSAAIYVCCTVLVVGWVGNAVPWWIGLIALFCVASARKAALNVRAYNEWWERYQGMGSMPVAAPSKGTARKRKPANPWNPVIGAALSLLIIAMVITSPQAQDEGVQDMLVLAALGFTLVLISLTFANIGRAVRSRKMKPATAMAAKASAPAFVQWVMPPASSSPSLSDAIRSLPDYCARLLKEEWKPPPIVQTASKVSQAPASDDGVIMPFKRN